MNTENQNLLNTALFQLASEIVENADIRTTSAELTAVAEEALLSLPKDLLLELVQYLIAKLAD